MENTKMTPPVEKSPEEIQEEMAQVRESLSEKVAALENQVVGSVQTAAETISGTVDAVKNFVEAAPRTVTETVQHAADVVHTKLRETLNFSDHIRRYPWLAVGTCVLAGGMIGMFVLPPRTTRPQRVPPTDGKSSPHAQTPRTGLFDEMNAMVGRKLREIAEHVIDTAATAVDNKVRETVPKVVDAAAEKITALNA
ncbi:MAG TPA: hypothetical protein VLM40_08085 [Gemmata sp.]|nr:hypothetical protein [Gemmata sp.]